MPAMAGRVDLELSPDPFVERLRIHCRLPATPALLSVRIYDAEGGLVARLRDWEPAAYEEIVHWDGRHQDGWRCPPGLYVVSVQASADGRIVHGKAVVARQ
jgi:flagellar hook assembly protein FlgD